MIGWKFYCSEQYVSPLSFIIPLFDRRRPKTVRLKVEMDSTFKALKTGRSEKNTEKTIDRLVVSRARSSGGEPLLETYYDALFVLNDKGTDNKNDKSMYVLITFF